MFQCPLICAAEFTSEVVNCGYFPNLNDYKAKSQPNITNVLENIKTFFPNGKYLYSHDSVMQTLLFILSTCTRSEYRTKILNTP